MKTTIAALSLLLLASSSQVAFAQDKDRSEARAEALGDREPSGRMGRAPREAPRPQREFAQPRPAPEPPRAREAPVAPSADGGGRRRAEDGGRGGGWIGRGVQGRRPVIDTDGDDINDGLTGADRQDREDRDELRQRDRWVQGQTQGRRPGAEADGQRRGDGDRAGPRGDGRRGDGVRRGDGDRGGPRGDNDRRGDGARDGGRNGDRRWDGDRDGRRGDYNRRWDSDRRRGPPANHPRWDGRRYPQTYSSRHRYRGHFWTPPLGFYVHVWNFGDVLPRGWYEPNYRILDWWTYDLPVPPPGYVWVRVRDDALLIDEFNGRVVQVVRDVFW